MTLLFETPLTRVFYEAGTSDYSLITFAPFEDEFFNDDKNFWGSTFTRKNNVNCLALSAKSPHWYPQSEINLILEKLKAFEIHIPNAVAYGTSMGGYAALKYGKLLGAIKVLSFSPQYTLDQKDIEYESVYTKRFIPHLHTNVTITDDDLTDDNYIFYDKYHEEDYEHYKKIVSISTKKITGITINYLGHKTSIAIAGSTKMNGIIKYLFISDIKKIQSIAKKGRYDSVLFYGILAKRNQNKRPNLAAKIALKGLTIPSKSKIGTDMLYFALSYAYQINKNFSSGLIELINAYKSSPKERYLLSIDSIWNKKRQFLDDDAVKAYYNFNDAAKQDLTDTIKKKFSFFLNIRHLTMVWQVLCDYYIVTEKHFSHQPRLFRLIKLSALDLYHVDKLQLIKNMPIYMRACKNFYYGQSLVPAIIQLRNQINFDDNHADIYKNILLFLEKKQFDLKYVKQVMEYFDTTEEQSLFLKYFFKNNSYNFQTDEQKDFFHIIKKLYSRGSHFTIARLVQGYINKKYNKDFLLPAMKKILSLYQPYIFSNKKIKRHNLLAPQSFFEKSVIFATSASALKNSIYLLKGDMDYICYLYDPNKADDLQDIYHIPKRNIKIHIKDLLQETCYEHSDFDIKIIHFIKNISNKIGSHTEYFLNKHNSYDFAIPNADIFSLAFQDASYQMMRRIFGFIDILSDYKNIYIFSDKVDVIKILIENIYINYSRKKIIFSHGLSKARFIEIFQEKIADLLGDTLSNLDNIKIKETVVIGTGGYKKIHDYIQYDKDIISSPQKNGIMLSVIPQDGNYHKFGKYCATEILKRHIPLYFASSSNHNAMAKKLYTDIRDYDALLPADMHNFPSEYLEFFDVLKKALKTEVKDFVHLDQINTQKYLYDKIDYFVENRVLFCILYYNYMRIFLQKSDTKAVILSPGRSLWGWIITYAAQYHNILTVDVQTVVQSAHPRYYPTKCDIMTFMESEQYRLYQQTFPECTKKHSLIGSVIFDEVLDDLKEIQSLSDIKSFYKDYDNQKIVCVATQYSNGEHYLKIIQVLNDLTADLNFKLLVKIHPRETDFYISAFSNTIQNNPLAMFLDKTHSINHIIYDSDVIVTLFSNVGFLAALQQKEVIRPMLMPDNLPLDFVETGIAVDAQTPQELKKVLFDLLNQGEAKHNLIKTRKEYFDKNLFFQKSTTSLENLFELDEIKNLFSSHLLDKNTKA